MRAFLLVVVLFGVFYVHPRGESDFNLIVSLASGAVFVILVVLAEFWIRRLEAKSLLGAAAGAIIGALGAYLVSPVIARMDFDPQAAAVSHILILVAMVYLGVVCGVYGNITADNQQIVLCTDTVIKSRVYG